tara:strand:- start:39 stop:236 length:198 start_codon:yes stop_codon:yes gene_type:complete
MAEEVIRYGAGGKPYVGKVGEQSTEAPAPVVEEEVEEPKVEVSFEEDDTPLSDSEVVAKATGNSK